MARQQQNPLVPNKITTKIWAFTVKIVLSRVNYETFGIKTIAFLYQNLMSFFYSFVFCQLPRNKLVISLSLTLNDMKPATALRCSNSLINLTHDCSNVSPPLLYTIHSFCPTPLPLSSIHLVPLMYPFLVYPTVFSLFMLGLFNSRNYQTYPSGFRY